MSSSALYKLMSAPHPKPVIDIQHSVRLTCYIPMSEYRVWLQRTYSTWSIGHSAYNILIFWVCLYLCYFLCSYVLFVFMFSLVIQRCPFSIRYYLHGCILNIKIWLCYLCSREIYIVQQMYWGTERERSRERERKKEVLLVLGFWWSGLHLNATRPRTSGLKMFFVDLTKPWQSIKEMDWKMYFQLRMLLVTTSSYLEQFAVGSWKLICWGLWFLSTFHNWVNLLYVYTFYKRVFVNRVSICLEISCWLLLPWSRSTIIRKV